MHEICELCFSYTSFMLMSINTALLLQQNISFFVRIFMDFATTSCQLVENRISHWKSDNCSSTTYIFNHIFLSFQPFVLISWVVTRSRHSLQIPLNLYPEILSLKLHWRLIWNISLNQSLVHCLENLTISLVLLISFHKSLHESSQS